MPFDVCALNRTDRKPPAFLQRDPLLRHFKNDARRGPADALNDGLRRNEFITYRPNRESEGSFCPFKMRIEIPGDFPFAEPLSPTPLHGPTGIEEQRLLSHLTREFHTKPLQSGSKSLGL